MNKNFVLLPCLALTALFAAAVPALTQEKAAAPGQEAPAARPGRGQLRAQRTRLASIPAATMKPALGLSDEQAKKIKDIQDKYRKEFSALMPKRDAMPTQEQVRPLLEKMQAKGLETDKEIEGVLNEEQKKKLPAFVAEVSAMNSIGIPATALPAVKLTADQKTKLTAIATDLAGKIKALSGPERREKSPALRQEANTKAMALLTEEQKKALEDSRSRRRPNAPKKS